MRNERNDSGVLELSCFTTHFSRLLVGPTRAIVLLTTFNYRVYLTLLTLRFTRVASSRFRPFSS